VADRLEKLQAQLPVTGDGGPGDTMLELWGLGIDRVRAILTAPDYVAGKDHKRDRLMADITNFLGNQILRVGEGLLRRERTDKIGELLAMLQKADQGDPTGR
jgi:hypothetical protein